MNRLEEMRIKSQQRKEREIAEFLENVNRIIDNTDSMARPSVTIKKEMEEYYITYHITQYPNCKTYYISRYKKDYPFSIYYSKEWIKESDIPKQYKETFAEIEKCFK